MKDEFRTIKEESRGLFKDRGSKFIAIASPVTSYDNIKEILVSIRRQYHDARHHCYAYRLGTEGEEWRINDDGEPSGTAGNPIIGQLKSYKLTNVLIVVVRYFGGTLLGTSGLINAYRSATRDALENAEIIQKTLDYTYQLEFPYSAINEVMKIVKEEKLQQSGQVFEMDCTMKIHFRASLERRIRSKLELIDKLQFWKVE